MRSGEVLTGIILQEGPNTLIVGQNDGSTREISRSDVEERKPAETSIMPEGLVKTSQDLRDILAYLLTPG
jgi:putative heme-binding domain-containing protein